MHPFRAAVEARDLDAMMATMADDVTMHSPFAFTPFAGRESVAQVLGGVLETLGDLHYVGEAASDELHCLRFAATINGEVQVEGVDLLTEDADGQITDITVMLRPANALMAMGQAMAPKVEGAAKAI